MKNFNRSGISNRSRSNSQVWWPLSLVAPVSPLAVLARTTAFVCSEVYFCSYNVHNFGSKVRLQDCDWLDRMAAERSYGEMDSDKSRWKKTGERVEELQRLCHSLTHMSICVYALVYGCTVCYCVFTVCKYRLHNFMTDSWTIKSTSLYLIYALKRLFCYLLTAKNQKSQMCITTMQNCWVKEVFTYMNFSGKSTVSLSPWSPRSRALEKKIRRNWLWRFFFST